MVNNWKTTYQNRQTTVERAISSIKSYQKVFVAPFCNEPQTLIEELVRQKDRLHGVNIYNVIIGSPCLYADFSCHQHFNIRTFLGTAKFKSAYQNQAFDYLPVNLSELPNWIAQEQIDIALIQVSPPNEEGFCNLGISVDIVPSLIKNAKVIIAQVNNQLPSTHGDTQVHISEINNFVLSDRPLLTTASGKPNKEELQIGKHVAELIPDYATIQVGLGKIADSIILSLKSKKGLGIHSGSIIDAVTELIDIGVITNESKEINRYKTVCTTITGSENLYKYADDNQDIELYAADYTHNPAIISQISNFYSVNSALEVDVFGQVNAEKIGEYPVAGLGGQMDFIHGARLSKGGKAIIALPSTARRGTESRIKMNISAVTSLKSEIDYVVTEYGVASLFGKSLQERADALISIAHPKFRGKLSESLKNSYLLN